MQEFLPAFNAGLNSLACVLIFLGWLAIRQRAIRLHMRLMLSALAVSALFLVSYLFYHFVVKQGVATSFQAKWPEASDSVRNFYYVLLVSHTILAVAVAFLAPYTAWQAWKGRIGRHKAIAHWTLPIWLYVSVTGVVVYWMLYRLYL
jgi:putative membrane protein